MDFRALKQYAVYAAVLVVPAVVRSLTIHRKESETRKELDVKRQMLKDLYESDAFKNALPTQQERMISLITKKDPLEFWLS